MYACTALAAAATSQTNIEDGIYSHDKPMDREEELWIFARMSAEVTTLLYRSSFVKLMFVLKFDQ